MRLYIILFGETLQVSIDNNMDDRFNYTPSTEDGNSKLSALNEFVSNRQFSPTPKVDVPKFEESPYYLQALRYAEPDFSNDDLYPGLHDSVVVGNASNKTLGSFPIFGSGFAQVLPLTMIASKRRKVVMDYILDMEKAKAQAKQLDFPKTPYVEAEPSWDAAVNNVATSMYSDYAQKGQAVYGSIAGSDNPAHPGFKQYSQIGNFARAAASTTKSIADKVKAAEQLNLSPTNSIGRKTYEAINAWKQYSALPIEIKQHLLQYGDGVNFRNGSEFMTFLHKIGSTIDTDASIFGLANPVINDIKEKAESYVEVHPGEDYDTYITNKLESQYPVAKDQDGNLVLSKDSYLDKITKDIAGMKKELFQDYDPNNINKDAPYKMEDLRQHIANTLGYSQLKTVQTARNASSSSAANQITATPQWLYSSLDKVKSGETIAVNKNNAIIPGTTAVLFNNNGVITAVPRSHQTEIVDNMLALGAKDPTQFGAISSSEAQVNARNDKNLWSMVNSKVSSNLVPIDQSKSSEQQRFNSYTYNLSGNNGIPISEDISLKKMNSVSKDKSADKFYFTARLAGKNADESGTIIPANYMEGESQKPWLFGLLSRNEKASVSMDGSTTFMSGTFYKKEKDEKTGVYYYTIYDNETKKPFLLVDEKTGDSKEIRLREEQVKKIIDIPTEIWKKMESQFPDSTRNTQPSGSVYTSPNVSTKQSKGQSAGTVDNTSTSSSDDIALVARYIKETQKNFKGDPNSTAALLASSTDAGKKSTYAAMLKNARARYPKK